MRFIPRLICLFLACALLALGIPSASTAQEDQPKQGVNPKDVIIDLGLYWLFHHKPARCKVTQYGWIEPSQGVWQDDDFFEDTEHKELKQLDARTYSAQLRMALNRDTLLFGIYRPVGQQAQDRRNTIMIGGESWYSTPVAVKIRITRTQGGIQKILYESPVQYVVQIGGSCLKAPVPFAAALDASQGIPPPPTDPFQFTQAGPYTIRAELYDAQNHATGLYTEVSGEVVDTQGPAVQFIPVYSGKEEARKDIVYLSVDVVTKRARELAQYVGRYGGVYFPLPGASMDTVVRAPRDIDSALANAQKVADAKITGWKSWLVPIAHGLGVSTGNGAPDAVAAQLMNDLQGTVNLTHTGRVVILTRGDTPELEHDDAMGFTFDTKTIFAHPSIAFLSVLHEIVHTEPQYLWTGAQMQQLCNHDYHDNDGDTVTRGGATTKVRGIVGGKIIGVAYGVRTQRTNPNYVYDEETAPNTPQARFTLNVDPAPANDSDGFRGTRVPQMRERFVQSYEIMGSQGQRPNIPETRWITQCTYRHLVDDALQQGQDPHFFYVRAVIAHGRGHYGAYFNPVYDVEASAPAAQPGTGPWNIVLLDASGAKIATYGFTPTWHSSDSNRIRSAVPLSVNVPFDARARTMQLRAPSGVVASLAISAQPPSLHIDAPTDGTRAATQPVLVRWTASTANGAKPLASVYYSADGKIWLDRVFQTTATSAKLYLATNAAKHWIKVIVTDGSRSSEQTITLTR